MFQSEKRKNALNLILQLNLSTNSEVFNIYQNEFYFI
jgi:hypothetical protein